MLPGQACVRNACSASGASTNAPRPRLGSARLQERAGEDENVLAALPQRRDNEGERVDPKIQIAAEFFLLDQTAEVLVGRGDKTNIDASVTDLTQATEPLLL